MPFDPDLPAQVEEADERNWRLLRNIRYQARERPFLAEAGMCTDFASVPRVFVWLLPRYGRYTRAAIVHDHLWRQEVPNRALTLKDADGIFRRASRELGVPFLQRWVMWAAVRWGGVMKGGLRQISWWIDLPRVLLVSVLVAPIVLPPALLVGIGYGAFVVVESVLWLVLLVGKVLGRLLRVERPDKVVNPPKVSWKL